MKIVQVQFASWDRKYNFDAVDLILNIGDKVIVSTELGIELGNVVGFQNLQDAEIDVVKNEEQTVGIKKVIRKALFSDFEKIPDEKQKKEDFKYCKKIIEKYQLSMKLIDVYYSFDGLRITFPFVADSRVDFRKLVKDLTKHFNRAIRLQQVGIRDEAKFCGGFGHCGRPLCCNKFLNDLNSITSDMAELQQCSHRGSERISGICGRLMCCLAYEQEGYKKMAEKMPMINSEAKVEGRKCRVIANNILKQTTKVLFNENNNENGDIIEVETEKIK